MDKIIEVSDADFEQTVLQSNKPVLVDFWAPWCRPCQMLTPVLNELAEEYGDKLTIAKVDIDQYPAIASKYSVMTIPNMFIFKDGQPVSNIVGFKPKSQLKQSLDKILD
ncbi:thioredoxin [Chloroflexota bacterium]